MAISFPSSPTVNQTYTYNSITWTYNGTGWTKASTTAGVIPTQSGNTGKYLTTDGTSVAWGTVTTTPTIGTTAQRPASPETGLMRINSDTNYLETYYNSNWISLQYLGLLAGNYSGPIATTIGNYRILTYLTSGSFTVTAAPTGSNVEVLLIGGGGGGGTGYGGGGGAGGYYYSTTMSVPVGTYPVIVGAGGTGTTSVTLGVGASGTSTTFNAQTAVGGGGGGEYNSSISVKGTDGGSGGGAGGIGTTSISIGTGTATQGNNGGVAIGSSVSTAFGGGGGGAGATGTAASGTVAGNGGVGVVNPVTGSTTGQNVSSIYYVAGGGGGGGYSGGTVGSGGTGGGGAGILSATSGLLPTQLTFTTGWTYSGNVQTNTNSIAPDGSATATLMTAGGAGNTLYYNKTGLTGANTYMFTIWIKVGTATNFAIAFNNAAAWDSIVGKTYTTADGLNTSTWTKISHSVTGQTTINMHILGHSNGGQAQQTAGTLYMWAPTLTTGTSTQATSGTINTGGGGGGSGDWTTSYGGGGGAGLAIIKYRYQ